MGEAMSQDYFISERDGLVVLSLDGVLDRNSEVTFEESFQRISAKNPKCLILNMTTVTDIRQEAFRSFTLISRKAKANGLLFLVSGISDDLRALLLEKGLVDRKELSCGSLAQAIIVAGKICKRAA